MSITVNIDGNVNYIIKGGISQNGLFFRFG